MRIRKHAKIPLMHNHVCQLNQWPWDVITFPNEDPSLFQPPPASSSNYQFAGCVDHGTFNNSNETVVSVAEDVDVDVSFAVKKINREKDDDIDMEEAGSLTDQNNNDNKKQKQHEVVVAKTGSSRRQPVRAKKSSYSSFNPYDFYYYSGFGPSWGQKRCASRMTNHLATSIAGNNSTKNVEQCSSSQVDNEELDYVELADEDDHHEEENGKKKKKRRPLEAN